MVVTAAAATAATAACSYHLVRSHHRVLRRRVELVLELDGRGTRQHGAARQHGTARTSRNEKGTVSAINLLSFFLSHTHPGQLHDAEQPCGASGRIRKRAKVVQERANIKQWPHFGLSPYYHTIKTAVMLLEGMPWKGQQQVTA